jgi:hypothetical protein
VDLRDVTRRTEADVGLFKQMKEMKTTNTGDSFSFNEHPQPSGTRRIVTSLDRTRQQPASNGAVPSRREDQTFAVFGPDFEPIATVSLELYARICRGLDSFPDAGAELLRRAEYMGITPENWRTASAGWSARVQANPAVEWAFSAFYDEV